MKAVVFDMDGVLFDTERLCMEVWMQVAKESGLERMEEFFPKCIGLNSNDTRQLIRDFYGDKMDYEVFREAASLNMKNRIKNEGLPVKKGVHKILNYLKQLNQKIGLASSTRYASVISHLKEAGIVDYFQVIVTGDMIDHSKPQPDIYLLACRKLGVEPEEAYAIEDSLNGLKSAHAAGMKPVLVPDLVNPDEEMKELSFLICDDLPEVMKYIP